MRNWIHAAPCPEAVCWKNLENNRVKNAVWRREEEQEGEGEAREGEEEEQRCCINDPVYEAQTRENEDRDDEDVLVPGTAHKRLGRGRVLVRAIRHSQSRPPRTPTEGARGAKTDA